jgi:hypothetical protein
VEWRTPRPLLLLFYLFTSFPFFIAFERCFCSDFISFGFGTHSGQTYALWGYMEQLFGIWSSIYNFWKIRQLMTWRMEELFILAAGYPIVLLYTRYKLKFPHVHNLLGS